MVEINELDELLRVSDGVFFVLDTKGTITSAYGCYGEYFNCSWQELVGRNLSDTVISEDRYTVESLLQEGLGQTSQKKAISLRMKRGENDYVRLDWNLKFYQKKQKIFATGSQVLKDLTNLRLQALTQEMGQIGSWKVDIQQSLCVWSPKTYEIHELDAGTEIEVDKAIEFYIPEHRPIITELVNKCVETGEGWDVELMILTAKGNRRWVRAIGRGVFSDGQLLSLEGVFQDIHEKKSQEEKLKEKEREIHKLNERSRIALSASYVGIWDWNVTDNILLWDKQMFELYGIKESDFSHAYEAWAKGLHPDDFERSNREIEEALSGKTKFDTQFRVIWPDGEIHHIRAIAKVIFEDGVPVRMLGVNWDISEIVEKTEKLESTKEALHKNQLKLEVITNNIPMSILHVDLESQITFANKSWFQWTKSTKVDGSSGTLFNFISQENADKFKKAIGIAAGGKKQRFEFNDCFGHAVYRDVQAEIIPEISDDNSVLGLVIVLTDISLQKKQLAEVKEAHLETQKALESKAQFLANMSHEIRTPLNGILGMSSILNDKIPDDHESKEIIKTIDSSGENLLTIINDILDFSKLEAGKFEIFTSSVNLNDNLRQVINLHRQNSLDKNLDLKLDSKVDDGKYYMIDGVRLQQIIGNLVSNAIKFTENGSITVELETNDYDDRSEILVNVIDTGIGLEEEQRQRLFKPFSQVDGSTTRRQGGTGLGLSICKALVKMMEGSIEVQSEAGKGSQFKVRIPSKAVCMRKEKSRQKKKPVLAPNADRLSILVAEDNATNQLVLKSYLKSLGYQAKFVNNGQEALDALDKNRFDVILMDCHMPVLDGYEASRKIREKYDKADQPLIYAVTASVMQEDVARCEAAGMDRVLRKPLKKSLLLEALQGIESQSNKRLAG